MRRKKKKKKKKEKKKKEILSRLASETRRRFITHNIPPLTPILSHLNPFYTLIRYLSLSLSLSSFQRLGFLACSGSEFIF
jgi:hypothetical protein